MLIIIGGSRSGCADGIFHQAPESTRYPPSSAVPHTWSWSQPIGSEWFKPHVDVHSPPARHQLMLVAAHMLQALFVDTPLTLFSCATVPGLTTTQISSLSSSFRFRIPYRHLQWKSLSALSALLPPHIPSGTSGNSGQPSLHHPAHSGFTSPLLSAYSLHLQVRKPCIILTILIALLHYLPNSVVLSPQCDCLTATFHLEVKDAFWFCLTGT